MDISADLQRFAQAAAHQPTHDPIDPRMPERGTYITVDGESLYVTRSFLVGGQVVICCHAQDGTPHQITL